MKILLQTLAAVALVCFGGPVWAAGLLGPSTYDECILENMKGVSSDMAARLVQQSCYSKFVANALKGTKLSKQTVECNLRWNGTIFVVGKRQNPSDKRTLRMRSGVSEGFAESLYRIIEKADKEGNAELAAQVAKQITLNSINIWYSDSLSEEFIDAVAQQYDLEKLCE